MVLLALLFAIDATGTPPDAPQQARDILADVQLVIDTACHQWESCPNELHNVSWDKWWWNYGQPHDPWGNSLFYRKLPLGYELFSNGPDGVPYTNDDVLPSVSWGSCTYVWAGFFWANATSMLPIDPVDKAGMDLHELWALVWRFRTRHMRYPGSVGELLDYERRAFHPRVSLNDTDPWGEPYVCRFADGVLYLYSKGPDRIANTEDDVVPGSKSKMCKSTDCGGASNRRVITRGLLSPVPAYLRCGTERIDSANRVRVPPGSRGCGSSLI